MVGVSVGLGTAVASTIRPVPLRVKYKTPAPIARKTTNKPIAIGRLRVNSGILVP
jgi:hypothetical protein